MGGTRNGLVNSLGACWDGVWFRFVGMFCWDGLLGWFVGMVLCVGRGTVLSKLELLAFEANQF